MREEGVSGFFKGFGASMLNTFSMREYFLAFRIVFTLNIRPNRIRLFLFL